MSKVGPAILFKMARDAKMLGLVVVSLTQQALVIDNGSNALTVSYVQPVFSPPQVGGVDDSISPFLGIGPGNPGQLALTGAAATSIPTLIDGIVAAQLFAMLAGYANDINLVHMDGTTLLTKVRGDVNLFGMGQ
jgi:hypothetical protein